MAKKKAGAGAKDTDAMTKTQLKAYHREICDFFLENGWRETLSHYQLSPKQASTITEKVRAKKDKEEAKAKAQRKKAKGKKKAAKKTAKAKAAPKAPPKGKVTKEMKSAAKKKAKKRGSARKRGPGRKKLAAVPMPDITDDAVLDYLLNYRSEKQKQGDYPQHIQIDEIIIDLTSRVRAAA